jgi:hypothetical protein
MASAPALDMGKLQTFAFKVMDDVTAEWIAPSARSATASACSRRWQTPGR